MTSSEAVEEEPAQSERPGLPDFLRYFLELGTYGFGGPIATVGYMQRDLVERRKWIEKQDFLDGIALGQTMPGPLAAQVAMWVGFLARGAVGALSVAGAFILPSFVFVLGLAYFYVRFHGLPWMQSVFYGVAPAVMAIIALAAIKLAKLTDTTDNRLWTITAAVLIVTAVTGSEVALLFVAAGLLMIALDAPPAFLKRVVPRWSLFAVPAKPVVAALGVATLATQLTLFLFFLKAGAFIFGSGLTIVPFLQQGVVHDNHWLTQKQFLDAVAVGLITPGPVVITATFIGYLVGGFLGAGIATVAIFLPIYLGVVVPGPWFVRHRNNAQIHAFVKGATAAAAGAIGGATIVLTRQAITDVPTVAIALIALGLLWKFKVKEPIVVVVAGVAGLLLHPAWL